MALHRYGDFRVEVFYFDSPCIRTYFCLFLGGGRMYLPCLLASTCIFIFSLPVGYVACFECVIVRDVSWYKAHLPWERVTSSEQSAGCEALTKPCTNSQHRFCKVSQLAACSPSSLVYRPKTDHQASTSIIAE